MSTNIVVAAFGEFREVRTRALYKWDYGQILRFEGLNLPDTYIVHFSNDKVGGESVTMIGNADGVEIPNECLTTGQPVYAWVYLNAGADDGETVYSVIIPIKARPRPCEDVPTPVQQGAIEQAIAALNTGVAAAQEAAQDAEQIATDLGDFDSAMRAVTAAKEEAAGSAANASTAAGEAAESAAEAAEIRENMRTEGAAQISAIDAKGREVRESIPEEYADLSKDVVDLKSQIDYLDVDVSWASGHYFNSYGAIIDYEPFSISDFIPIETNGIKSDVFFTVYGNTATYCVFYDANKTQISVVQIGSRLDGSTVGVDGVAYVRLTNKNDKVPIVARNNYSNAIVNPSKTSLPVALELGTISGTGAFADANFRMRTIDRFSLPVSMVLSTDWTKYIIGLHRIKNNVYEDVGWQRADVTLVPGYAYEFLIGRIDYSGTALTIAEQTEIREATILSGQAFLLATPYKWAGKKWTCIGDSLTAQNAKTKKRYFDFVHDATGITTINLGISGTGYANGDGSDKQFYNRVSSVPTDSDVVTIFGSFNDLATGLPLGTITDSDTTTIAGCMNKTIDDLFAALPLVNLGIVTPTPWQSYNAYLNNTASINYVQMLVDICEKRGIPCLDLYHCSGLRPWDADYRVAVYSEDGGGGTHPNETGHKLIAPRFEAFLESLLLS